MFDLQTLILDLRPDLRRTFGFDLEDNRNRFLAWLITTGSSEYRAITEDSGFAQQLQKTGFSADGSLSLLQHLVLLARPDVQKAFPLPAQHKHFIEWFYTHGIEEYDYWPFLSETEKRRVLALPEPWGTRLKAAILEKLPASRPDKPVSRRPFGVNLIGYAFGQLGIGEDVRMAGRALLAAGVRMTMLDFPPGKDIPQNDHSMTAHVADEGGFAFNLFCITAEETGRFYAERGSSQFRNRYSIGYWPWELGKWPRRWEMLLELVDEVWVSTQHTHDALMPVCSKPLRVMPMAVQLGEVQSFSSRGRARKHFGLPEKATLFCFAFDLNSHVGRKNPQACIDAFAKAFPKRRFSAETVGLVIKVSKPARKNRAWEKLKEQVAKDKRIHIIEGTLPRPELLALYQACDCFLSLHRAEGFGRGLAEALQLGLHVICTGYSGNVDFCKPPYADLVRYKLVKVRKSQYVHTEGQVWAEPDVEHAAELMRDFVLQSSKRRKKEWPEFSPQLVGERYRQRLEEVWSKLSRS